MAHRSQDHGEPTPLQKKKKKIVSTYEFPNSLIVLDCQDQHMPCYNQQLPIDTRLPTLQHCNLHCLRKIRVF